MYWEKRNDRSGQPYYSFIQYDTKAGRNMRLRRSEVPSDIKTDAQADAFCRMRESTEEATKLRIQRKLAWQKQFYNFEELLTVFEVEIRGRAPNSWKGSLYYLRQYAFDFFLNKKECNNLNNWHLFFDEFKDWLLTVSTSKKTKGVGLAYNSRNNVIGALNTFLDVMRRKGKCEQLPKCPKFPAHLTEKRTAIDVISQEEAKLIESRLQHVDPSGLSVDFFVVLLSTGMRLGEGLGISLADFFPGAPQDKLIAGSLERHNLKCYGYISLETQVANSTSVRGQDGNVKRKPLKGRKVIDAKSSRIIPITDKTIFNRIAKLYNQQASLLESAKFGLDKRNYLLFDGLSKSNFSRSLSEAYSSTRFRKKTPHCARHTFATNFAGMTNADTALCRLVLGHRDEDTTLGYVHLFEQINRQARSVELTKTKIELLE